MELNWFTKILFRQSGLLAGIPLNTNTINVGTIVRAFDVPLEHVYNLALMSDWDNVFSGNKEIEFRALHEQWCKSAMQSTANDAIRANAKIIKFIFEYFLYIIQQHKDAFNTEILLKPLKSDARDFFESYLRKNTLPEERKITVCLLLLLDIDLAVGINYCRKFGLMFKPVEGITQEIFDAICMQYPVEMYGDASPQLKANAPVEEQGPPPHTGSNKDNDRIEATRQACESVRAEIEQGNHGFQVKNAYKTNQAHFLRAVQHILGNVKPRRDTVREEWKKVSNSVKHIGRVPEQ